MKRKIKRFYGLRLLLIILGFSIAMITTGTHRASAEELKKYPYLIKINRVYNTITIFQKDENGEYTDPVKAMICSVGREGKTKAGTYQTKEKYRWKLLMGDVWGQYSTRIVGGILFHSVYYYGKMNPATLATNEFNKLGTTASHGCVRLAVNDAKWIYDNCDIGTTVIIYDDKKSPGPLGKPKGIKIASTVRWDPTDPNTKNPYKDHQPVINGVKSIRLAWNSKLNLLKGINARSAMGEDITKEVMVQGKVNTYKPGKYEIVYSVTDALGKTCSKSASVTVENNKTKPKFTGISNRVIGPKTVVNEKLALKGVEATCQNVKIEKGNIEVTIDKLDNTQYYITYTTSIANGPEAVKAVYYRIDQEAPEFTGITDRTLAEGQIPDNNYLLENVTVSDNYTAADNIKVDITIKDNPDGTYLVTYEASDEVGNKTSVQATMKPAGQTADQPAGSTTTPTTTPAAPPAVTSTTTPAATPTAGQATDQPASPTTTPTATPTTSPTVSPTT